MSKYSILILLLCSICQGQVRTARKQTDIQRIETLTEQEKSDLDAAYARIAEAETAKDVVEAKIAAAHKMDRFSYMEYSTWWIIDGDWIFYYFRSVLPIATVTR